MVNAEQEFEAVIDYPIEILSVLLLVLRNGKFHNGTLVILRHWPIHCKIDVNKIGVKKVCTRCSQVEWFPSCALYSLPRSLSSSAVPISDYYASSLALHLETHLFIGLASYPLSWFQPGSKRLHAPLPPPNAMIASSPLWNFFPSSAPQPYCTGGPYLLHHLSYRKKEGTAPPDTPICSFNFSYNCCRPHPFPTSSPPSLVSPPQTLHHWN